MFPIGTNENRPVWEAGAAVQKELKIEARITPEAFREYSYFDIFTRRKRYRGPLLFFLILAVSAGICFTQVGRRDSAAFLGGVLLAVGLGLPVVYFASFFSSVRRNAKLLAQKKIAAAYTVLLNSAGVVIPAGEKTLTYAWDAVFYVYRLQHSTCVYVEADRAYMLPRQDPETEERLWALLCQVLPAEKRFDRRK